MDRSEIEGINRAEELLLRVRSMARTIEARVWAVIEKHASTAPPAPERRPWEARTWRQEMQTDAD